MRLASQVTSIVAAAALWLPYAAPALCTTLAPRPAPDHQACGEQSAQASLVAPSDGATCDLGACPSAPTAPPGGDLAELAVVPAVDVEQPEPAPAIAGEALAPPTPPPLL